MTFDEFVTKYNGKFLDYDGAYGNQCVDLADCYAKEVLNRTLPPVVGAKNFWDFPQIEGFDKIPNTPKGFPSKGDIIIFGIGEYGHVSICVSANTDSLQSFDQNYPLNSPCHLQVHDYLGDQVLGWYHPKETIYKGIDLTNLDSVKAAIDAWSDVANGLYVRKSEYDLQVTANSSLVRKVDDLTASYTASEKELKDASQQILDLEAALEVLKKENHYFDADVLLSRPFGLPVRVIRLDESNERKEAS